METLNSVNDKWEVEVQDWIPLTAEQEEKMHVIYPTNSSLASQGIVAPQLMFGFQNGSFKSCTKMFVNDDLQMINNMNHHNAKTMKHSSKTNMEPQHTTDNHDYYQNIPAPKQKTNRPTTKRVLGKRKRGGKRY